MAIGIPVPPGLDRTMRQFLQNLKERVQSIETTVIPIVPSNPRSLQQQINTLNAQAAEEALAEDVEAADPNLGSGDSDTTAPTVPTNVVVTGSVAQAQLYVTAKLIIDWDASTDTGGTYIEYEIQYWNTSAPTEITTDFTTDTVYTVFPAKIGSEYKVKIRAIDASGNASAFTSETAYTITGDAVAPDAPSSATATAGLKKVIVAWTNPVVSDFIETDVYRSTSPLAGQTVGTLIGSFRGSTWIDDTVTVNTTYYYKLKARDVSGNASVVSTEVSATPFTIGNDSDGVVASRFTNFFDTLAIRNAYIDTLDAAKITTGFLAAARIDVGTITASMMNVSTLSSITANVGTLTAGTITGVTINTAASGSRVELDSTNGFRAFNGATQRASILTTGSGWFGTSSGFSWDTAGNVSVGALTATSTITGAILRTASTNKRIEVSSADNEIAGYNASNVEIFRFGTTPTSDTGYNVTGRIVNAATTSAAMYIESAYTGYGVKIKNTDATSGIGLRVDSSTSTADTNNTECLSLSGGRIGASITPKNGWATEPCMHLSLTPLSTLTVFPSGSAGAGLTSDSGGNPWWKNNAAFYPAIPTYATFDGAATGTHNPDQGHNITNVIRNGTGDYTITFAVDFPDTNYCMAGSVDETAGGSRGFVVIENGTRQLGTCGIRTFKQDNTLVDFPFVNVVFFGRTAGFD